MSKLVSSKHRLDREIAKRDELQKALRDMQETFVAEKRALCKEHEEAVDSLRKEWDSEKELLLEAIQVEFNKVLEEQLPSGQSGSWRSDAVGKFISKKHKAESPINTPEAKKGPSRILNPNLQVEKSRFSKVDKELRETEALVRGLIREG